MPLSLPSVELPRVVREFLQEADDRIARFCQECRVPGFVPSDFPQVYHALHALQGAGLAAGTRFCEWGSGFGIVTCLAGLTGFEAYGIEIDAELVEGARQLADDFGIRAEFLCDSFVPRGSEACLDALDTSAWMTVQAGDVAEKWGLGPEDFDVIYVYPWPEEERSILALFERTAATGALLLTYHGQDGMRLRRKVRGKRKAG